MAPGFAARLDRFHEALSPSTVRRRFLSVHPHLSAEELRRFTDVDHQDREALVVVDGAEEIVAVGRFDRLSTGSSTAEVAFVVADAWQHHGIGRILFVRLAACARARGIDRLIADTAAENRAMRTLFRHSGYPVVETVAGGIAHVTIDLRGAAATAQ